MSVSGGVCSVMHRCGLRTACRSLALNGGEESLDVRSVHGDLVISGGGGAGRVRDLHGSLTVFNEPLEPSKSIHGNVSIQSTITANPATHLEMANEPSPRRRLPCSPAGMWRAI